MEFDTIEQAEQYGQLLALLRFIEVVDRQETVNYPRRERLILKALLCAKQCNIASGIRIDPLQPEWPVVFFELPTGQVSWHLEQHAQAWDGHTTDEKYQRIRKLLAQEREAQL